MTAALYSTRNNYKTGAALPSSRLLRRLSASVALILSSAACFAVVTARPAMAADPAPAVDPWYVGLQGGMVFPDRAREEQNAGFAGLRLGKVLGPDWNVELNALESRHSGNHGMPGLTLQQYSVDALRVFDRAARVAPFLRVGVGLLQDEPRGQENATSPMVEGGLGVIVHLWTSGDERYSFDLRPEVDARWDGCRNCGQSMTDGLIGIGFDLDIGGQAAEPPPAPAPAPRADVIAPPPAPPPPPPAAALAPAPRPSVAPPAALPPPEPIVLTRVHFALNSAQLKIESRAFLDRVAAGLQANPEIHVVLEGYTDSTGTAAYNLQLSRQRADAVRGYLIDRGVPAAQMSAEGMGKADPIATNRTAAGRQANRRTIMRVTSNPGGVPVQKALCGSSC